MRKFATLLTMLMLFSVMAFAQDRVITGTVKDETGSPVPGASIRIQGSTTGTASDQNGLFRITAKTGDVLLITGTGIENAELKIGETSVLEISVKTKVTAETEVVVTSFGKTKKSQFAGAVTTVAKEKINFVPIASFDQILQGRVPGVLIGTGSGQPGASARVVIRGVSSISGGNAPLYIVDGMPVEQGVFQSINPNDFESVQVLRDAISTAQYGNRGSNGVIVATSKRGKSGKVVVSYNIQYGTTRPGEQKFNMMTSAELLQFQEILGKSVSNSLPGWSNSPLNPANAGLSAAQKQQQARTLDSLRTTQVDWQDVFQRRGSFRSHDLNFSGGTGTTRYFISGSVYSEDGIGLRSDLDRYTLRANLDNKTDKFTISFSNSIGYTKRNFIESENGVALANPFAAAYLGLPYHDLFGADGKVLVGAGRTGPNAYDRISTTTSFNNQLKALSSLNIEYNLTDNIYLGTQAGVDYRVTDGERSIFPNTWASNNAGFPTGPPTGSTVGGGSFNQSYSNFLQYNSLFKVGYRKNFKGRHDIDVKLVTEYTKEKQKNFNYTGFGINEKLLNTPVGITPGTTANALIPLRGGGKTERTLFAGMLQARYTLDDKYTFSGSFRRDASSQLAKENRWATFYAAGLSWNILKESFTKGWKVFNELTLRGSYGTAANADGFFFGDFGYLPTYGGGTYAGGQTIVPTNPGNPDVTWEKIATANIGLDFAILKRRITGTAEIYQKLLTDGIISQALPAESGFGSQPVNAAKTRNKGYELTLNFEVIRTKDVTWSIGGNYSYNHNRIVDLGKVNEFEQGTEIVRVGLPIGSHYLVQWGGVDAATGAPLYYTRGKALTNIFSDNNRVADFGTYNAPSTGGFNTTLTVGGFTLDALFTFQRDFARFNNQDFFQLNHAFAIQGFNLRREMLTMWQNPGDVTNIQAPVFQRQFSSKDIQDASFLRFRNATVSYALTERQLGWTKFISGAKLFVQGQNLFTWTNWSGFDPEDNNNIAQYEYPTPRTFTVGFNVTFK